MQRSHWTYIGQIDCFGVPAEQRDRLFSAGMRSIWDHGGELQIAPAENQYDTDRYDLHCELPGHPTAFKTLMAEFAEVLPDDHRTWQIEGYNREMLQREDLLLRSGELLEVPFSFEAQAARPVGPLT